MLFGAISGTIRLLWCKISAFLAQFRLLGVVILMSDFSLLARCPILIQGSCQTLQPMKPENPSDALKTRTPSPKP